MHLNHQTLKTLYTESINSHAFLKLKGLKTAVRYNSSKFNPLAGCLVHQQHTHPPYLSVLPLVPGAGECGGCTGRVCCKGLRQSSGSEESWRGCPSRSAADGHQSCPTHQYHQNCGSLCTGQWQYDVSSSTYQNGCWLKWSHCTQTDRQEWWSQATLVPTQVTQHWS